MCFLWFFFWRKPVTVLRASFFNNRKKTANFFLGFLYKFGSCLRRYEHNIIKVWITWLTFLLFENECLQAFLSWKADDFKKASLCFLFFSREFCISLFTDFFYCNCKKLLGFKKTNSFMFLEVTVVNIIGF